jgi:uncharacterized lipoprotein YmbA
MTRRSVLLFVTVLLAGCGFFSRPKNQFYSLETVKSDAPVRSVTGTPVGIDAIELPPGLDRRGIVLHGKDHKIEVRGTHQWTASLEEMVVHTLAFDLANRLPAGMVVLPGQAKPGDMRSISVVFEELAAGPEPVFVLDARWTIGDRTTHERIEVPMPSMESPALVAAMNQAVAELAGRMAAAL